jgi:hypothetical protein
MPLPPDATAHSHALLAIAREMTDACPSELGLEIALAGSVARGWADEHSDIELNFWVEMIEPWRGARTEWLTGLGAENIHQYEDWHENGSRWLEFDYKGVAVEAGWHAINVCDSLLRRIVAGEVDDMSAGFLAESLHHSTTLRDGEHLRRWRSCLAVYPGAVQRLKIESGLKGWRQYYRWFELDLAFLLRPEPALIAQRIDVSIRNCMRILFAVNQQWEPDQGKWIVRWSETLELKPDRLADRIYAIYAQPLARESYADLLSLVDETLMLVPAEYNVSPDRVRVASTRNRLAALP